MKKSYGSYQLVQVNVAIIYKIDAIDCKIYFAHFVK